MRKFSLVLLRTLIYLVLAIFFLFNQTGFKAPLTIKIELTGNSISNYKNIKGVSYRDSLSNYSDANYFKDIVFIGSIDSFTTANISIGNRNYIVSQKDILNNKTSYPQSNVCFSLVQHLKISRSNWPILKKFINWEGFSNFLLRVFTTPIILVLTFVFFLSFTKIKLNFNSITKDKTIIHNPFGRTHFLLAILIFIVLFIKLETVAQYYFLQDDNYVQFFPVIYQNLVDFYSHGIIPNYNFYQNAGLPTMGYSIYSLTYPLTHLSFLISKYVFQNELLLIETFVFIHFLLGYIYLLKILERLHINFYLASTASLCFIFCGFNLYAIRGWYYVAPSVFFVPLLCYLRIKWTNNFTFLKMLLFGAILALYAYGGNVQFWIYSVTIWIFIEGLILKKGTYKQQAYFVVISLGIAILLFLPQLVISLYETNGLKRTGGTGVSIGYGINGMLHPFPEHNQTTDIVGDGNFKQYNWVFLKNNFVFAIISFISLFQFLLITKRKTKIEVMLLATLFMCLLYGCGRMGLLFTLSQNIPFFNKFTHPFKAFFYINLLFTIIGVIAVNKIYNQKIIYCFCIFSISYLYYQIHNSKSAFYAYAIKKHYDKISVSKFFNQYQDYRILPIAASRDTTNSFMSTLRFNTPTFYKIPSLECLEVLNPKEINIAKYYSEFSARYILLYKSPNTSGGYAYNFKITDLTHYQSLDTIYTSQDFILLENKEYTPLITFYNSHNEKIIATPSIKYLSTKVTIKSDTAIKPAKVLLTFNYRKNLRVYADEKKVPIIPDSINRVLFFPTFEFKELKIKYEY